MILRTVASAAVLVAAVLPACAGGGAAGESPAELSAQPSAAPSADQPAQPPAGSPRVVELVELIRSAPQDEASEGEIAGRIGELDRDELRALAEALAEDTDAGVEQLRAGVLFELGDEGRAAAVLAGQVARGIDLGGLFWGWMHAAEPRLATRRYVAISRALLERYDRLDPEARRRADLFLCEESFGGALDRCTPEQVRRRLDRLEQTL